MPGERVALVTGASRGIGKQTALHLADRGVQLVLAARTVEPRPNTPGTLTDTAEALRAMGVEPLVVRADVAVQEDLDRLVAVAFDRFGGVDILVNNAAYTVGRTLFTHVPELTREQWDKHFAINVTAPLMLTQALWNSMRERGGGVVVNLTSGAAALKPLSWESLNDIALPENGPAYGSSKAALNRMANVTAQEGMPYGIAVVNVDPGFVLTETMAQTFAQTGVESTDAISPEVPAKAIAHICTCEEPLAFSGRIVQAPALVDELGL